MIKYLNRLVLCLSMLFCSTAAFAEYVPTKIYIFGFSASFNDSTVYVTEVQELDSAWVERKWRFLYERNNYAYQLKEQMQQMGVVRPTCVVMFAKSRKEADKKYSSLLAKYKKSSKAYTINTLTESMFKFEAISAADDFAASHKETKEERKQHKAEAKAAIKEQKDKIKAKKLKDKQVKAENKAKRKAEKKAMAPIAKKKSK